MQKGTFEWALNAMRNGSRVRRAGVKQTLRLELGEFEQSIRPKRGRFVMDYGRDMDKTQLAVIPEESILATDWEIVEAGR